MKVVDFSEMSKMPSWDSILGGMSGPGVTPGAGDFVRGMQTLKYNKTPIVVSEYHADVFDMCSDDDRKKYCETMLGLMPLIQNAQAAILRHELQTMPKADGSSAWMRYLEWFRYKLNDSSTTKVVEKEDDKG